MTENSILQAKELAESLYYDSFTILGYDLATTASASGQILYDDNASTYDLSMATDDEDIAVTSSHTDDAQSITIKGINKLLVEVQETLTLDGYTPVLGTVKFYRINEVINNSSTPFAGKIFICKYPYNTADPTDGVPSAGNFQTNVRVHISIGFNRLTQGLFTVPAGYRAYVQDLSANQSLSSTTTIFLRTKLNTSSVWTIHKSISVNGGGYSNAYEQYPVALVVDAGYDISLSYLGGTANSKISSTCNLILEKI